jgi:hypothetical protein
MGAGQAAGHYAADGSDGRWTGSWSLCGRRDHVGNHPHFDRGVQRGESEKDD